MTEATTVKDAAPENVEVTTAQEESFETTTVPVPSSDSLLDRAKDTLDQILSLFTTQQPVEVTTSAEGSTETFEPVEVRLGPTKKPVASSVSPMLTEEDKVVSVSGTSQGTSPEAETTAAHTIDTQTTTATATEASLTDSTTEKAVT